MAGLARALHFRNIFFAQGLSYILCNFKGFCFEFLLEEGTIQRHVTFILKNKTHWYLTYVKNWYFRHDVIAEINENNLRHIQY